MKSVAIGGAPLVPILLVTQVSALGRAMTAAAVGGAAAKCVAEKVAALVKRAPTGGPLRMGVVKPAALESLLALTVVNIAMEIATDTPMSPLTFLAATAMIGGLNAHRRFALQAL